MNLTSIKLTVTGAHAWATVTGPLTSGMVGLPVTMEYDEAWDGLTKNLMCRCSPWGSDDGEIRTRLNVGEVSTVAHEVMQQDMYLYLGVEGFSTDGTLVIPTTWAKCGKIEYGANTCEDPSTDPELTVWNQLQAELEQIRQVGIDPELVDEIKGCAQSATEAAADAERAKDQAAAASEDALGNAAAAKNAADAAQAWADRAGASESSAADLANSALQAQRAAEAAAERAEAAAGMSENQSTAAVVMIRAELCGCDLSNPVMLHPQGAAYETVIKPRDHHIAGSVYVEVGGVDVTKDVYDPATDTVSISAPTADVLIEAFCPEKQPEKTVDLVLFSGQSNMSGRGDGALAAVCPEGEGYWYKDGGLAQITGYFGNEGSSTGSMVSSVAKAYFDSCGVPIVAVSNSFGGTKISQFAPGNTLYTNGMTLYNEAAAYLEEQGYTVRKKAMVWCQGESDAYDGVSQADYEAAFLALRDHLKTDCGIAEFFLVEIGQYKTDLTMYDEIKAAQEHLTATEPDIIMASRKFIGATGLMKDVWHYTQAAYNLAGRDTGIHMAYYHATGIRPRTAVFSAADVTDQDTPVDNDELDPAAWDYTLYEDTGIVGLNQYIGSAADVTVKAQYKVGGVNYATALDRSNKTGSWVPIFKGNTTVRTVTFEDGIVISQNGNTETNIVDSMFEGCTALEHVYNVPPMLEGGSESTRSAQYMYNGCTAIIDAPVPENVKNLSRCWLGCAAMSECTGLPATTTKLTSAFSNSGIVHVPDIPDSVTAIQQMCQNAKSVESVGVIGSGVTAMQSAFNAAGKLAGVVRIESENVANMTSAFAAAAIPNITFEVPAGSTTYATLMAAYPAANVRTF